MAGLPIRNRMVLRRTQRSNGQPAVTARLRTPLPGAHYRMTPQPVRTTAFELPENAGVGMASGVDFEQVGGEDRLRFEAMMETFREILLRLKPATHGTDSVGITLETMSIDGTIGKEHPPNAHG
jgi:hypothetical protein